MRNLIAKVLPYPDLHKRDSDMDTVRNYRPCITQIEDDLDDKILEGNYTHAISGGDLYDKGYGDHGYFFEDTSRDKYRSDMLEGKSFIVGGNHTNRDIDRNPELYLIQPNPKYPTRNKLNLKKPVLRLEDKIKLGKVQFNLFHWQRDNKMYVAKRDEDTFLNVGLYHDESVIPNSIKGKHMGNTTVSSEYMKTIFKDIDIAIIFHWHIPQEPFKINVDGRDVWIYIPGSLCHKDSSLSHRHAKVSVPAFEIYDDGTHNIIMEEFSTHLELLTFNPKKEEVVTSSMIDSSDIETYNNTGQSVRAAQALSNIKAIVPLEEKLRTEVDENAVIMSQVASSGSLDFMLAMKIAHGRID